MPQLEQDHACAVYAETGDCAHLDLLSDWHRAIDVLHDFLDNFGADLRARSQSDYVLAGGGQQ